MKYVVQANQVVNINGSISESGTVYDGMYTNEDIPITTDFLQFEHTDGLNYINFEFRRFDKIFDLNKVKINLAEGLGRDFYCQKLTRCYLTMSGIMILM